MPRPCTAERDGMVQHFTTLDSDQECVVPKPKRAVPEPKCAPPPSSAGQRSKLRQRARDEKLAALSGTY